MTSKDIRKTCVKLSLLKMDSLTNLFNKPLWELSEIISSVNEVQKEFGNGK